MREPHIKRNHSIEKWFFASPQMTAHAEKRIKHCSWKVKWWGRGTRCQGDRVSVTRRQGSFVPSGCTHDARGRVESSGDFTPVDLLLVAGRHDCDTHTCTRTPHRGMTHFCVEDEKTIMCTGDGRRRACVRGTCEGQTVAV